MSKSLGNYIGVVEPPEEIYGKTMSIPDALTETYLRLLSGLAPAEVDAALALGPRDAKASLARRLVARLHGEDAAAGAAEEFDRKFRRRELPEAVPEHRPADPRDLAGTMAELGWYPSRSAARRVAEQGGVRVNGERRDAAAELRDGDLLQAGRRNIVRIRVG
jgi:tyrosyl-tRNA synthetase